MKITIECDNGQKIIMEYEKFSMECQVGVKHVRKFADPRSTAQPNGHERLTLRAWSGCPSFESFVEDEVQEEYL